MVEDKPIHSYRYFLWRFSLLCSTQNFLSESYTWPLLVYMLLICLYPFTSSCAHTFSTMSPEARHICYFFDYGALSLYSLGMGPRGPLVVYCCYCCYDCHLCITHHSFND